MSLPTFGQLLSEYMQRSGISDSELARSIGVRRQTIFRWKEGLVERPRAREDVLQCAKKLRLTDEERDRLLLAAGFAPMQLAPPVLREASAANATVFQETLPSSAIASAKDPESAIDEVQEGSAASLQSTALPEGMSPRLDSPPAIDPVPSGSSPLAPLSKEIRLPVEPAASSQRMPIPPTNRTTQAPSLALPPLMREILRLPTSHHLRWWPLGGALVIVVLLGLLWTRGAPFLITATPTLPPPATVLLHPPPQTPPQTLPADLVADEGETLLLVAQFTGVTLVERFDVAERIGEALSEQITTAPLMSTTVAIWPEEIPNAERARQVLAAANATMLIWGKYDSGRVRVNLETGDPQGSQKRDFTLTSADELVTTINSTVPHEIRLVALMALGRLLRNRGNYPAATAAFQGALVLDPEDQGAKATLNFYLGYLAEQGGSLRDLNRAVAYYTRAIELDNQLSIAYYNRGTVQIKRYGLLPPDEKRLVETLDAALADLRMVITYQPTYRDAYLNRGVAYYERDAPDDMAAALRDLSRAIALKADYAHAHYLRGLVQIRAGEGMGWVEDFQQTLALQPDHAGAISGLCWGYVLAQQAETALTYCDQAVELDTTGASRDSRGIAYAQLGRYAEAIADFRAYLALLQTQEPASLYERQRGPLIEQWIIQLEAGENPFGPTLLEKLRHRDHYDGDASADR